MRFRPLSIVLFSFASAASVSALVACGASNNAAQTPHTSAPAVTAPAAAQTTTANAPLAEVVDEAVLDKSAQPCEDFYQFACGGWLKSTPIPDDRALWGRGFSTLEEKNLATLKDILEKDAAGQGGNDAYAKQLGDYYAACMDEDGIEKRGVADLKPELDRIDAAGDGAAMAKELAHLHTIGASAFFNSGSENDAKDASLVIGTVVQSGLGLPDRDYYLEQTDKRKQIRADYQAHVEAMFKLLGETPEKAKADAATVMRIETKLAESSMSRVDRRDPKKRYHRLERDGLKKTAPVIAWDAYFAELGVPDLQTINVAQPDFMKGMNDVVKTTSKDDMRAYLRWHLVRRAAPTLGKAFVDESFKLQQSLSGTKTLEPRWKRCVRAVDRGMGEALGQAFVKTALGEEGKQVVKGMVDQLQTSMSKEIDLVSWMDPATRAKAHEKLSFFGKKIGFPDQWRNYDALHVDRSSYFANREAADVFETHRDLAKIGKPVDRGEWEMTPPTINAYYRPDLNEIVFPAGILQAPFYAKEASRGLNYGGIGAVMGHEITHGFDDSGRQYDGHGNLTDWWTPSVGGEFEKRANCVVEQFNGFVPVDDLHVNGKLTLGENLADLGGLKIAYAALERAQAESPEAQRGQFTAEQQFFLGWAQGWCTNTRDETVRQRITTDPHAPPRFRVNGPMSNLKEFAAAWSCKAGSAMVRPEAQRCEVW